MKASKGLDRKIVTSVNLLGTLKEKAELLSYSKGMSLSAYTSELYEQNMEGIEDSFFDHIRKQKFLKGCCNDEKMYKELEYLLESKDGYEDYVKRVEKARKELLSGKRELVEV